jgi:trehalose 6-phosphate phosphatase
MARTDPPAPPPVLDDGSALFLDFDGTLVELAETPGAIRVPIGLGSLLKRVSDRLGGRVAIISGRSVKDLDRYLDSSGFAVSGSHGLEMRLRSGELVPLSAPVALKELVEEISRFAEQNQGLVVEEKPFSIALHYRQAPKLQDQVLALVEDLASAHGFSVQHGKMVAEVRPRGADKGDALRVLMKEPEFTGARPVFVGDDLTDEVAFEAAAEMGGDGILVGNARASAARYRLPDVASVAAWLSGLVK